MAFKECSNGMKESSVYQEINPQMVQLIKKPMCVGQTGSGLEKNMTNMICCPLPQKMTIAEEFHKTGLHSGQMAEFAIVDSMKRPVWTSEQYGVLSEEFLLFCLLHASNQLAERAGNNSLCTQNMSIAIKSFLLS